MNAVLEPQWSFAAPDAGRIRRFLDGQSASAFSYAEVGSSLNESPAGYVIDHNQVQLGHGEVVFAAACQAVREWKMFPAPWTRIAPMNAPLTVGTIVAMQAHALGLWWLNSCRIVYVIDEISPVRRFGFAYGTLPSHVEQGEERFSVELRKNGSVWYDIRAFSKPRYWPVRLAKPIARALQRRFVRDSKASMIAATRNAAE